ncbi:MAG: hypothetical protein WC777_03400 [Candidatus Gracilibacteria bacterium]|jgi:hypothetical protein
MKKFLLLFAITVSFAACSSQVDDTAINSGITIETDDVVAVESPEALLTSFTFGSINYELDYPSSWTYADETYDSGGVYTQFYDAKQEKTMMIDCDWQGGMEAEILQSDTRTFEKQDELVKVKYSIFGTQDNVGNGNIGLSLAEWSEEKSQDYYCQIFFQPPVAEAGLVEEIFSSIR